MKGQGRIGGRRREGEQERRREGEKERRREGEKETAYFLSIGTVVIAIWGIQNVVVFPACRGGPTSAC